MRTATKWVAIATKKARIRKTLAGTPARPRLSVYRSEQHIYGQIIDDVAGRTLASASTRDGSLREQVKDLKPLDAAKAVGEALAAAAQKAGITAICFDRNGRSYAGRLKALADAARAKGLQF